MSDKYQPPPPDDEDWGPNTPWQEPSIPPIQQQPPPAPPPPQWQPPQYGQPHWQQSHPRPTPTPETYLVPAILVTLFCFLPTGIAAIVYSSQVSSKSSVGDFQGAAEASRKARLLSLVSLAAGVGFWVIIIAIGMATSSNTK